MHMAWSVIVSDSPQPSPQSPAGDFGDVAGHNGMFMCQGGKPGTGKLDDVYVAPPITIGVRSMA